MSKPTILNTGLAVINILISLKVMAIAALFLLFTLVFPLGLLPPGDTADSIYAAAEELGVSEKTFRRYIGIMSKEADLLPEIVENGTDPVSATRLFLDLVEEEYPSRAFGFVFTCVFFWLGAAYFFIGGVLTLWSVLRR